ncbi:MAG: metal-dependent hydrolase [Gammaproteobacteria bacterium]|nr:MAG: metal-dependent hydrolase [Gammaproteobacteria bacterium]
MAPGTHLLTSWLIGAPFLKNKKERMLVTVAGVIPDIDGAGIIIDKINMKLGEHSIYYEKYHHVICHNLLFAIIFTIATLFIAKTKRVFTASLAFFAIHIHMVADIIGSKGPDGYQWPLTYFYPFNNEIQLTFKYQWQLSAWPNSAITIGFIVLSIFMARKLGYSPYEIISTKFDKAIFALFKKYF